jgi:undecaprenyl diphosphate synthase
MHVAIIMDGNGRWAAQRRLPRPAGHRAGAKSVNTIVETAVREGVDILTLYAFSAAIWQRPPLEVRGLFTLLRRHLLSQTRRCIEQSVRINVIGRRDRLAPDLVRLIENSEALTAGCTRMHLRLAIDYSAQYSLMQAAARLRSTPNHDADEFAAHLAAADHSVTPAPPVDLLIRTGGEKRLSDFLLWESAYAELHFVETQWPDFGAEEFRRALSEFSSRERRFGGLPAAVG